ncbi:MAG: hypothetical protein HOH43_06570 [Candidatus Latescibacteria bacterium]|jgi:O-acetylhomoserine (thiol)-lyase|nr:hypothetical protein [Candidatus Latescibacterota bacterium]
MLDHRLTDYSITTTFVDMSNPDSVTAAIQDIPLFLYLETISNPTMKVPAISPLGELVHRSGFIVVCDNTFASPFVTRPLEWGGDLVLQSATKFIAVTATCSAGQSA